MHTKEPWHVVVDESEGADYALMWPRIFSGENEIVGTEGFYTEIESDKANARRVVACVNACAGISTSDLEMDNVLFTEALRERVSLSKQRDELLAALKYVLDDEPNLVPRASHSCREYVRAAIKKCEA